MASALPPNLQVEVALDRGRLSSESTRSPMLLSAGPQLERIQSFYGDVDYMPPAPPPPRYSPSQRAASAEEGAGGGMMSAAELAAALDQEEDEDDIAAQTGVMHEEQWYSERSPARSDSGHFAQMQNAPNQYGHGPPPRAGSLNTTMAPKPYPGVGVYAGVGGQPKPILMNGGQPSPIQNRPSLSSPPPRSTSVPNPQGGLSVQFASPSAHVAGTYTAPPTPTEQHPNGFFNSPLHDPPNSAPIVVEDYGNQQMQQPRAFADKPRFTLTDDGPASAPGGSAQHPGMRRVASDSNFHSSQEGESALSAGLTPPMRRAGRASGKYSTFEDMGIQGKSQAQVQSEEKECVIM